MSCEICERSSLLGIRHSRSETKISVLIWTLTKLGVWRRSLHKIMGSPPGNFRIKWSRENAKKKNFLGEAGLMRLSQNAIFWRIAFYKTKSEARNWLRPQHNSVGGYLFYEVLAKIQSKMVAQKRKKKYIAGQADKIWNPWETDSLAQGNARSENGSSDFIWKQTKLASIPY